MTFPGFGKIGADSWHIDGDTKFSVISEHIMEPVDDWHWKDLKHDERMQLWTWYHAPYNHKIGGWPTALLNKYKNRIYAFVNDKFPAYYAQGMKWQELPCGTGAYRNRDALLDPCNAYGHNGVDVPVRETHGRIS